MLNCAAYHVWKWRKLQLSASKNWQYKFYKAVERSGDGGGGEQENNVEKDIISFHLSINGYQNGDS